MFTASRENLHGAVVTIGPITAWFGTVSRGDCRRPARSSVGFSYTAIIDTICALRHRSFQSWHKWRRGHMATDLCGEASDVQEWRFVMVI